MTSINFDFSLSTSTPAVSGWPKVLLSDVADINAKTARIKEMGVINYTDISSVGTRTVQSPAVLKSHEAPSRAKRLLTEGDTVISTVRPNRKSYFFFNGQWDNAVASTGFVVISPKDLQDANFIHYILTSEDASALYERICEGGAYPAFNGNQLASLEIPWPEPEIRNFIGSSIANLDRKIETNIELSKILEDIAQTIFKSWFIDFDPVKAKMAGEKPVGMDDATAALFPDSMEDSELGLIPKGWELVSLGQIGDFLNGLAMQKFPVVDENNVLPVIKISQLRAGNTFGADIASGLLDPKYIIKDGDVLFSWSGTLEVEIWSGGQGALNQHLFKVTGNLCPDWFAYFATRYFLPTFRHIASGKATTMGHIQRGHLTEARMAIPADELIRCATTIIGPLLAMKISLMQESKQLSDIRDSLLPRLISGELQIPEEMLAS